MKSGAQAAERLKVKTLVIKHSIPNSVLTLPSKVFVVKSVILVESKQVVGQYSDGREVGYVDKRMRWRYSSVVTVNVHHDRNDGMTHRLKKSFKTFYVYKVKFKMNVYHSSQGRAN